MRSLSRSTLNRLALVPVLVILLGSVTAQLSPARAASCPTVVGGNLVPTPTPGLDWSGCDFSGLGTGTEVFDFSGINLSGAKFNNAILRGLVLSGATLTGTSLTGIEVIQAFVITNADLSTVSLDGSHLWAVYGPPTGLPPNWLFPKNVNNPSGFCGRLVGPGVDLAFLDVSNCDLSGADLVGANLTQTVLYFPASHQGSPMGGVRSGGIATTHTDISGTQSGNPTLPAGWSLINGYLVGPGADITNANLANADLSGVSLTGTTMSGVDLTGAKLSGVSSGGIVGSPSGLPVGYRLLGGYLLGPGVNLSGANLSGLNLGGTDLSGAILNGTNVSSANLSGANLAGVASGGIVGSPTSLPAGFALVRGFLIGPNVTVTGADLTGGNLSGVDLSGADLTGVTLTGVVSGGIVGTPKALPTGYALTSGYLLGPGVNLTGANLTGVTINGAVLTNATLTSANLSSATLTATSMVNANLTAANLTSARFPASDLSGASLTKADLTGVDLSAATLTNVTSGGITGIPTGLPTSFQLTSGYILGPAVNLSGATLAGAHLRGAHLAGANLSGANLAGTDLSLSDLTSANLFATDATNGNMAGANLTGATVGAGGVSSGANANWTSVNLSGANLTNVSFYDQYDKPVNLTGVNFSGANLTNAAFGGGFISQYGPMLLNANFKGANVSGTLFWGTVLPGGRFSSSQGLISGGVTGTPADLPPGYQLIDGFLIGPGANLADADLTNLNLSNTNLDGANLVRARLGGVTSGGISGTPSALPQGFHMFGGFLIGPGVSLAGADLSAVNLAGAQSGGITGVPASLPVGFHLTGGYLLGPSANLTAANLSGFDLSGYDLTGANLTDANLSGANLNNVIWQNATCADGRAWNYHANQACALGLEQVAPAVSITAFPTFTTSLAMHPTWSGTDGLGSGVASFDVRYNTTPVGGGTSSPWRALLTKTTGTRASFTASPGLRYCFAVRAVDRVGNVSNWTTASCTNTPVDDRAMTASPGWAHNRSSSSYAGTYSTTTNLGASLTKSTSSTFQVGIIASACSTCGKVAIFVGSTKVGTISLYSPLTTVPRKVFLLPRFKSRKTGAIKVVTIANAGSSGKYVLVDGLITTAQ